MKKQEMHIETERLLLRRLSVVDTQNAVLDSPDATTGAQTTSDAASRLLAGQSSDVGIPIVNDRQVRRSAAVAKQLAVAAGLDDEKISPETNVRRRSSQ